MLAVPRPFREILSATAVREKGKLAFASLRVSHNRAGSNHEQVEFRVNGVKTDYPMKLGDGGEAFFVFETSQAVPVDMQTSPLVSPSASPRSMATIPDPALLQEPDYLDIADGDVDGLRLNPRRAQSDLGMLGPLRARRYPWYEAKSVAIDRKFDAIAAVARTHAPSKR